MSGNIAADFALGFEPSGDLIARTTIRTIIDAFGKLQSVGYTLQYQNDPIDTNWPKTLEHRTVTKDGLNTSTFSATTHLGGAQHGRTTVRLDGHAVCRKDGISTTFDFGPIDRTISW